MEGDIQKLLMRSVGTAVTLKQHWTAQPRWEEATLGLESWPKELRELEESLLKWKGSFLIHSLRKGVQSWQRETG